MPQPVDERDPRGPGGRRRDCAEQPGDQLAAAHGGTRRDMNPLGIAVSELRHDPRRLSEHDLRLVGVLANGSPQIDGDHTIGSN